MENDNFKNTEGSFQETKEREAPIQSDLDHHEKPAHGISDAMQVFLRGHGWSTNTAEIIGEGREKQAMAVGEDKVLIYYHSKQEIDKANLPPEYFKAQFYLHKILHLSLPNNFPDVHMGGGGAILFDRVPDNPEFSRAKDIQREFLVTRALGYSDDIFLKKFIGRNTNNPEFLLAYRVLEGLGIVDARDPDTSQLEFAQPYNTVMVNDHPVLLEALNPVKTLTNRIGELSFEPSMNIENLAEIIHFGMNSEDPAATHLKDERVQNRILKLAIRYRINAEKTAEYLKKKDRVIFS